MPDGEIASNDNVETVAEAAHAHAMNAHELASVLNERLDTMAGSIHEDIGRVHTRLDDMDTRLTHLTEIRTAPEAAKEEATGAAELVIDTPQDVAETVEHKTEKKGRGRKGRKRRG